MISTNQLNVMKCHECGKVVKPGEVLYEICAVRCLGNGAYETMHIHNVDSDFFIRKSVIVHYECMKSLAGLDWCP